MKKAPVICLLLFQVYFAFAQKETYVWYFGQNAGINFNSGSPVPFGGSAMNELEGCSSIANSAGHILFYTDGLTVWNKNNQPMPNGTGLLGNNNSAQSALIVKAPGNNSLYYIFTAPTDGNSQMHYSTVDTTLQGGLGDVADKNVAMFNNSTEKVTAVKNANGVDIWVIGHEFNTNNFYSYTLTTTGLNLTPVVTSVGTVQSTTLGFAGYMKASHNGHKLAYATTINMNIVEVFDFDNSTGIPSNPITFPNISEAYGLEFSPDDTKLYATEENPAQLIQWDLSAGSASAIISSQLSVATSSNALAALQLGPDGKIYVARRFNQVMAVINNPNMAGTACNYTDNAFTLYSGTSNEYGLPNFCSSLFSTNISAPKANFTAINNPVCAGSCTGFTNLSVNATSYQWYFQGGNPSSSTDINPTACYSAPGKYDVELIATNGNISDTAISYKYIIVDTPPISGTVTASRDSICEGTGVTSNLNLNGASGSPQWQSSTDGVHFSAISSGDTLDTYTTPRSLAQTTYYRAMAVNGCGSDSSNVVIVHILPAPSVRFNYSIKGQQVNFQADSVSSNVISYTWDFGDNQTTKEINPTHTFDSVKTYYVCLTVFNGSNCSYTYCQYVSTLNTGVETVSDNQSIQLYPNPANNIVNLSVSGLQGNYQLKIYNVLGQGVKAISETLSGNENIQIDLRGMIPGTYELILMNNKEYYSKRFVHLR